MGFFSFEKHSHTSSRDWLDGACLSGDVKGIDLDMLVFAILWCCCCCRGDLLVDIDGRAKASPALSREYMNT